MCNACERPSTIWGVDLPGVAAAKNVERLLVRTLARRPAEMEDIEGYVTVVSTVPSSLPEDIGIGLAIYIARDPEILLATSRSLPPRPQQTAVAVFLGPSHEAPPVDGFILALDPDDEESATSVIAALVEAALLGPSGTDMLPWPIGTEDEAVRHVISGVVSQGALSPVLTRGRPTPWVASRGRGAAGAVAALVEVMSSPHEPPAADGDSSASEGMVVARVGSRVDPMLVRVAVAEALGRSTEWRVAVLPADGLGEDGVEIVVLGPGSGSPGAP